MRLGHAGPDKTYPVRTAALHELSLQVAPQVSVLHDSIFAEGRLWVLLLLLLLLSSFLHLTMAVLILLSPKVEAFPLTQDLKIRQVLLIKQPLGDGEGIRPDLA